MSEGWFYYEGDGNPKPSREQLAAMEEATDERLGPRVAQISIDIFENETLVHLGFGGDPGTPEEIRERMRGYIEQAIGELRRQL